MYTLKITTKFKRDLKRLVSNKKQKEKIKEVLEILEETGTVPQKYKPHRLKGNYNCCYECHILPDLLLIWENENNNEIKLIRIGTHSELF